MFIVRLVLELIDDLDCVFLLIGLVDATVDPGMVAHPDKFFFGVEVDPDGSDVGNDLF